MSSRLPLLTPEQLDERQRAVYDQVAGGPRASGPQLFALTDEHGALTGPFNALLHAPEVGTALSQLGEAIRYGSRLDARTREIAILTVAARHRSDFEWYAHERVGRHAGLTNEELAELRRLEPLTSGSPSERLAHEVCLAATRDRDLPDELHDRALAELGRQPLVELVMLVGYYEALALLLSTFRVPAPEPVAWD